MAELSFTPLTAHQFRSLQENWHQCATRMQELADSLRAEFNTGAQAQAVQGLLRDVQGLEVARVSRERFADVAAGLNSLKDPAVRYAALTRMKSITDSMGLVLPYPANPATGQIII